MRREQIEAAVRTQLSYELHCEPEDFLKEETVITLPVLHEKRRMFSDKPYFLQIVTFGKNAVISADESIHPWLRDWVRGRKGFWLFEQQNFYQLEKKLREYGYRMAPTHHMFLPSPEYLDIKQWSVEEGDCFTDEDIKKAAKVCVVGATIVKELFSGHDPIGKTIRFKSIPMRVVGVLKSKGYNSWGMDQDNVVIAPYTTVMKRIAAQTYFSSIVCSALTEELSDAAIEELTQMLRDNHKLKGDAADDFTIRSQAEMMETMSTTMDTVTLILVVAAAFSLLVAGIGIMNIMLVSVTERTKEIGLRMAVGATGPVISLQFLIESVLISVTGGLLGILVGCTASAFLGSFGMPSSVPAWSIYVSFMVCVFIGVLFGYIPAQKAANMDPIEAIRHE